MKKEMLLLCAVQCHAVYKKNIDLGTTEFDLNTFEVDSKVVQVLSIAGTNEPGDWIKNLDLRSKKGIKLSAYRAAQQIMSNHLFFKKRDVQIPLIVTGHSKAGATAIAFHKLYNKRMIGSSHCVAFAPARCLRYWNRRKMDNTYIFTDPDDPVSFFGRISFGLPKCRHYKAANNHFGFKVADHDILNWIRFCQEVRE